MCESRPVRTPRTELACGQDVKLKLVSGCWIPLVNSDRLCVTQFRATARLFSTAMSNVYL